MTFEAFSPQEVIEAVSNAGVKKGNMRLDKVFFSSVSAGCLLAFACGTVLSTNATPWYQENAAGLMRTIAALVFPYGLCMIILTGADLCTGSFMVCGQSPFHGAIKPDSPRLTYILVHNSRGASATAALVENVDSLGSDVPGQFGGLAVSGDRHLWLWVTISHHASSMLQRIAANLFSSNRRRCVLHRSIQVGRSNLCLQETGDS
jgi:hypothetical protein